MARSDSKVPEVPDVSKGAEVAEVAKGPDGLCCGCKDPKAPQGKRDWPKSSVPYLASCKIPRSPGYEVVLFHGKSYKEVTQVMVFGRCWDEERMDWYEHPLIGQCGHVVRSVDCPVSGKDYLVCIFPSLDYVWVHGECVVGFTHRFATRSTPAFPRQIAAAPAVPVDPVAPAGPVEPVGRKRARAGDDAPQERRVTRVTRK
eukprot:tig00000459_g1141.t1